MLELSILIIPDQGNLLVFEILFVKREAFLERIRANDVLKA